MTGEDVQVKHCRTLVALRNRIVHVVGELCTANNVSPHDANLVASLNVDDLGRYRRLEAAVASYVCVVHIRDGVVGGGDSDTDEFAIVVTVDTDALSDGVGRGESRKAGNGCSEESHLDSEVEERLNRKRDRRSE